MSAEVVPAADWARASSIAPGNCERVVRFTAPSSRPLSGSSTGTAAQV